jgi:hypothetical protein
MDQERADYGDPGSAPGRRARTRAHAALVLGAACYPPLTFLALRWGLRWFVQIDLAPLVLSGVFVPAVAIGTVVALREVGLPIRRAAVGYFALWAAVVAALQVWWVLYIYAYLGLGLLR